MPIHPIKDMNEFKRLKESLKNRFDSERSGDQVFQTQQTKVFEPLINIQKETSKSIKDNTISNQQATTNALVPLVQEMQRRNDQIDMLVSQPYYQAQIEEPIAVAESTPEKQPSSVVDPDKSFNEEDKQNLIEMNLKLPSEIFQTDKSVNQNIDNIDMALLDADTIERSLRQRKGSKKSIREGTSDMYKSQYTTLKKYISKLEHHKESMKDIVPSKTGKGLKNKKKLGVDLIICSNPADMYVELRKFCAAKTAGNSGVDNHINTILDKLLESNAIDIDDYDELNKKIFH